MKLKTLITTLAAAVGLTTAAVADTSTPLLLLNYYKDTQAEGWVNYTQTGGAGIPKQTSNNVSFTVNCGGGNFKNSFMKPSPDSFADGEYVDIYGATHTSLLDEIKTSLNLSSDIGAEIYNSGLAQGARSDATGVVEGLNPAKQYVVYFGFGLTHQGSSSYEPGFTLSSGGYGTLQSLEYVVTRGASGFGTVADTKWTSFEPNTNIRPADTALMIVRYIGTPNSSGKINIALLGERSSINFMAVAQMPAGKTYTATMSEDTTWDGLTWDPEVPEGGFESNAKLELTVTGTPTLTFENVVSGSYAVEITGTPVIKADDSLYEDGCWLKAFASFGELTAENVTFADIMEGYKGAYGKTATGFTLRAQNGEVISINIAGGSSSGDSPSANLVSGSDYYGLAPTLGDSWNNISKQWQGGNQTISIEGPKAYDGTTITNRETMSLSATGKNTWQCDSISNPFLRGYLDDGNGVTVTVHGIPYTSYDVIVYGTSDRSDTGIAPVKVNGTSYTFVDGETVEGDTAWGQGMYATPELGKNALKITGCSGDTLTINATRKGYTGAGTGRATLCAVQVICTGEVVFKNTYTATISDSTAFDDITWDDEKTFEAGQLNEATITVDDSSEDEVEISFGDSEMELAILDIISARDIKFTADSALSKVAQFIITGCTAKVTYAWPVSALQMTTDGSIAYAGGAGSDESAAGITFVENGDLTLTGDKAPYYIGDTYQQNTKPYTMSFTDATVYCKGWSGLSVGMGTVTIGGASTVEAEKCILSQGTAGQTSSLTIKDDAAVTITGTSIVDSNKSSIMFGHWNGETTFTLQDNATFTAENAQVLIGKTANNHTINLDGGTFTAKGIKVSGSATGTNTLNLAGGALVLGDLGLASYGSTKISVNVTNDSSIASSAATKITQPMTIAADTTLTLDASAGDIVISGTVVCEGTINVVGGNVIFMKETTGIDPTKVTTEGGAAFYGVTVTINDMGTYTPVAPLTTDNVKLYDEAGNLVEATAEEGVLKFDWKYTDGACWWDYEFNGNGKNTGSEGKSLSWDNDRPKTDGVYVDYVTNIVEQGETAVTNISLKVPQRPWRDVSTSAWPAEATYMFYGKMVGKDYSYQLAFGSKNGSNNNQLFFATRSVADGTVDLCYSIAGAEPTVLCTMNVPNAQASDHLYAVVIKDDGNGNSVVNTYLDGTLLQPYTHEGKITLGGGFQIASGHGGTVAGNYGRPNDNDPATIDWLRVYDLELNASVMKRLAEIYQYVSTKGKATRTVTSADTAWVEDDKWQQAQYEAETLTTNAPFANTMVEVTVDEAATLALNLEENANYEALEIKGTAALTLTGAADAVIPSVSGTTTIGTDVTVAYDAIKFGNVTVAADKTLTFDFATLDLSQEFTSRTIKLTGVATLGESARVETANITVVPGRTADLVFDSHTSQYSLVIEVEDLPFVYSGAWTWGGQLVEASTVSNNTAIAIVVQSDLEWNIDRDGITVEGSTLTVAAVTKRTADVTVEAGAVLDVNGYQVKELALTLNGGKVTNGGANPGEGDQIKTLTLTADSEIATPTKMQVYAAGYATATTIALDEYTLTKTGIDVLQVVNVDITGSGTVYVKEGEFYGSEDTRAAGVTFKVGADGTLHNREGKTMTLAKIIGEGGTLNNKGTMPGFELEGTLTIKNAGEFGTITNAAEAVVTIGTKRGLTFAGAGTVNVTLTDAEIADGAPITLFTTNGVTATAIGTITYNGADITEQCKTSGNQITELPTFRAKAGNVYYLTLQEALNVGGDVTVLVDVTESVSVAADKTVTLDLNGKTLQNDKAYYTIDNAGTLTVVDNAETKGTITHLTADTSSTIRNLGTLTISDITVGGTYIGIKNDEGAGCNGGKGYGELTLNGVTFNGDDQAVQNWGHATLNGGTYGGAVFTWADASNGGNVAGVTTIEGGTFSNKVAAVQTYNDTLGWPSSKATVTINGGTFEEKVYGTYTINYTGEDPEKGVISVPTTSSAQFKVDETPYVTLEAGYKFKQNLEGYYQVAAIEYATLTVTQVENCTIVVSNDTAAVESGAKFDVDDVVELTIYRTPAEGYELDGYEATEAITMTEDQNVTAAVKESAGKTVAPGGSPVQVTAESEEDAIAQVTLSAKSPDETIVSDEDYAAYFTKKAAPLSGNNWNVYAALKPEITAAEDETADLASELTAIAGGQASTTITGAKPGLWYSVEYTGELQTTEAWTEGNRAQAQADGSVTLNTPNEGAATFYTIKVNTTDKGTVQ